MTVFATNDPFIGLERIDSEDKFVNVSNLNMSHDDPPGEDNAHLQTFGPPK